MTVHLITFATPDMERSQSLCHRSAIQNGVDGQVFNYHPYDLTRLQCYEENKRVFDAPRGPSFWAWKAAVIHRTIDQDCFVRNINEGDTVIYSDSGVESIDNVNYIIDRMDQDVWLFGNMYEHAHWCKRDIVEAIFSAEKLPEFTHWALPTPWEFFGKQVQASVIFFRVNDKTRAFVKEWLDWCLFEGGRLIDDSPSRTPNHPEFQENRHDQAILTTMAYRDGIKLHAWPADYNDGAFTYPRDDYPAETYPSLFLHHRGVKTGERAA